MEAGLMCRDVWRTVIVETLAHIEQRTCPMSDTNTRVLIMSEVSAITASSSSMNSTAATTPVPWTRMPDPLLPVALCDDGPTSKISELLSEMHNLVHFNWAEKSDESISRRDTQATQSKLLGLARTLHEALTLRTTHESRREGSNRATRLHCSLQHAERSGVES